MANREVPLADRFNEIKALIQSFKTDTIFKILNTDFEVDAPNIMAGFNFTMGETLSGNNPNTEIYAPMNVPDEELAIARKFVNDVTNEFNRRAKIIYKKADELGLDIINMTEEKYNELVAVFTNGDFKTGDDLFKSSINITETYPELVDISDYIPPIKEIQKIVRKRHRNWLEH
jgi:hypothetical protein